MSLYLKITKWKSELLMIYQRKILTIKLLAIKAIKIENFENYSYRLVKGNIY